DQAGSALSREDLPLAGNALERPATARAETEPGAGDEILHRARNQHLARAGERRNPRADVHRDAADIVIHDLAFAGVKPGADIDAERPDLLGDRAGAAHAARGAIEGGQKSVAGGLHLVAAKAREVAADQGMMTVEKMTPALIAKLGRLFGRADDVGEEHGGENAIGHGGAARSRQEFLDGVGDRFGALSDVKDMIDTRKFGE